jgi:circadian clock protein KaiC
MPIDEHLKSGRIKIQQVDPAELSPGEFANAVIKAVDKKNARVVIIDSLNGYLNAMPDEKFLSLQLHELVTYLSQQGVVTIMTVAQHGLVGPMQSPVDVTYLADTVILMRYFEAAGRVKKALSVIKKRSGGHEDSIRELKMDKTGIQIGEPLKDFHGILSGIPAFHGNREEMLKEK